MRDWGLREWTCAVGGMIGSGYAALTADFASPIAHIAFAFVIGFAVSFAAMLITQPRGSSL